MNASILEAARIEMARRRQLGGILARDGYRELINRARMKAVHLLRPRDRVWPVFFEDGIATNLNRPSLTRAGSVEPVDAIRWVKCRLGGAHVGHCGFLGISNSRDTEPARTSAIQIAAVSNITKALFAKSLASHPRSERCARECPMLTRSWRPPGPRPASSMKRAVTGDGSVPLRDYEPLFHPASSRVLAENTYCANFHCIATGQKVVT